MEIKKARSESISNSLNELPKAYLPEYAFTGRSNVGKSSLINYLCNKKNFAPSSNKPGKTSKIHHYLLNNEFYFVDLPGYGYAKDSKKQRKKWLELLEDYLLKRKTLSCLFLLLDIRRDIQLNDKYFMEFCGENQIPLAIILTKSDKLSNNKLNTQHKRIQKELNEIWEPLPPIFTTSSVKKQGKKELLKFIFQVNQDL
ncbi:MAG: ribosome biogenesis GTP-binding protein YihA/YsxC [Flavobacteriales bacterium]